MQGTRKSKTAHVVKETPNPPPDDEPQTLGEEWDEAIGEKLRVQSPSKERAKNALVANLTFRWGAALGVLKWVGEDSRIDDATLVERLASLHPLIERTGSEIINAYQRDDVEFFDDLARVVRNNRREGKPHVRALVIETAERLAERLKRNPKGQELRAEYEAQGHPMVSDWTKMLKGCKLASFVKFKRGGARPSRTGD